MRSSTAHTPGPNLFLRHLPASMMEPELESLLSAHGRLKRLTVWKDHVTRQSKGFGMAEFETTEGAVSALKALQGRELPECSAPLEIEFHHGRRRRDGTPDVGAPCTNLYVRGLPLTMTEDMLRDLLRNYGEIKRLTIWKDQFGRSKGFGMCEYGTPEQARQALEALRGQSLDSTTALHVEVNPPKPPQQHGHGGFGQLGACQTPIPNLYIGGFPLSYNESDLQELVQGFGQVKRVTVWRDKNTSASKGFGLVEFGDVGAATACLSSLHGANIEGSNTPLKVEYNHPKSKSKPAATGAQNTCSNIFLKCLPLHIADADLHALLSQYGRIVRSTVWKDTQTQQSRGFGFCEFSNPVSANAAIAALNGAMLQGAITPIHVELHTKQQQPQQQQPQQQQQQPQQQQQQQQQALLAAPAQQQQQQQQQILQHHLMHVPPQQHLAAQGPSPNVFIKGLPRHYGEAELKGMLEPHGLLTRYTVWKDRVTQESRGFGMAQFENVASATSAISTLNGIQLPGATSPLVLEYHQTTAATAGGMTTQQQAQPTPILQAMHALPQRPVFP